MNRQTLKREAKNLLNAHFSFYLLLFLPGMIFSALAGGSNVQSNAQSMAGYDGWSNWDSASTLFGIVGGFLIAGAMITTIDSLRGNKQFTESFRKSFRVFENGRYFIAFICISLLQGMFVVFWTLLFIVPGIIKSFSYSQAFYIYRDHADNHDPIGYLDAITESRRLMDGHKADYFVLELSFILWGLLIIVTAGIAALWVTPYFYLTLANFYKHLSDPNDSSDSADQNDSSTVLPHDA